MVQSGFYEEWWSWAVPYFCFMRAINDVMVGGKTLWETRFGVPFPGPKIPLGAEITFKPITEKDKQRCHRFGSKMLSGVFAGYVQQAGGGWNGDLIVLDWEKIHHANYVTEVHEKRFKAEEVEVVLTDGKHTFPLADGRILQPGGASRSNRRQIVPPKPLPPDESVEIPDEGPAEQPEEMLQPRQDH